MENVLYPTRIEDNFETEEIFVSPVINTPAVFYVFVQPQENGKLVSWLTSDPDVDEEELVFDKNFCLAFEFKDLEHARRAKVLIEIECGYTVHIFGDIE